MYTNSDYIKNSFYGHSRPIHEDGIQPKFIDLLSKQCCNDNQVLNILFKIAQRDTHFCQSLSDIVENSDKYPVEVQSVLAQLSRQFPTVPAFSEKDANAAFDLIRSRYAQFGADVDAWAQHLASIVEEDIKTVDVPPSSKSTESTESNTSQQ